MVTLVSLVIPVGVVALVRLISDHPGLSYRPVQFGHFGLVLKIPVLQSTSKTFSKSLFLS